MAWLFISYMASLIFTLGIETPCTNLEKQYLMGGGGKKKKPAEKERKKSIQLH